MIPIEQKHTTHYFKAPADWDSNTQGECKILPVSMFEGVMYSYWKPSLKQKLQILFGYPIRLCMVGEVHPPVALDTGD